MIRCRKCNEWKALSAFTSRQWKMCKVCRACVSAANARHYKTVVKARRQGASVGALQEREKIEQALARVATGDSITFAASRVGVPVDEVKRALERRGAA